MGIFFLVCDHSYFLHLLCQGLGGAHRKSLATALLWKIMGAAAGSWGGGVSQREGRIWRQPAGGDTGATTQGFKQTRLTPAKGGGISGCSGVEWEPLRLYLPTHFCSNRSGWEWGRACISVMVALLRARLCSAGSASTGSRCQKHLLRSLNEVLPMLEKNNLRILVKAKIASDHRSPSPWRCRSFAMTPMCLKHPAKCVFPNADWKLNVPLCFPAVSTLQIYWAEGRFARSNASNKFINKTENRRCPVGEVWLKRSRGDCWTSEDLRHKVTGLATVGF